MKLILAILTVGGIIGVGFLFLQGGTGWIWALAGLCLLVYLGIIVAKAVTGDDNWLPWGGGPVD